MAYFHIVWGISISLLVRISIITVISSLSQNIFGSPSKVLGNLRTFSENVRQRSCDVRTSFGKFSESGRRSSENSQNRRHQCVYIIKRTLRHLEDMKFIFSWQEQFLTSELTCSCHSNIKFIPSRHRVTSSIYFAKFRVSLQFH